MAEIFSYKKIFFAVTAFLVFFAWFAPARAAELILSPTTGTFQVGSTFDVGVYLDTQGQTANVVEANILFPADLLQLVSPTLNQSVFSVWTAPPVFDNTKGIIALSGGIPDGLNVSRGLITTLTFRVRQASSAAAVRFSDDSSVLANDGSGTNILTNTENAIYKLTLPPPEGPIVTSDTNPDQSVWYASQNVSLHWVSTSPVEQFSYMMSKNPTDIPDDISDGTSTSAVYTNVPDGKTYFHIKSFRNGVWGGTTHFEINTDSQLPAAFNINFTPSNYTTSKFQILSFETTDQYSGIDHYETRIINLTPAIPVANSEANFFVESSSPMSLSLGIGTYDITVRAYNKVGKYQEATQRVHIVSPIFGVITDAGISFGGFGIMTWPWVLLAFLVLIAVLAFIAWKVHVWHSAVAMKRATKELPDDVKSQLRDLQKYRQKYGKTLVVLLLVGLSLVASRAQADQQVVPLSPPSIDTISGNISNQDIFYVGGKTDVQGVTVSVYMQNTATNETWSDDTTASKDGTWFYQHPTFLSPGSYLVWVQSKTSGMQSPPSSERAVQVSRTALQFGSSRLSYELIYFVLVIILLLIVLALLVYIFYHASRAKRKQELFAKEIQMASDSIDRGFAVLKRDIESEIEALKKVRQTRVFVGEEKQREDQLLQDLETITSYTKKEIWDIEHKEEEIH